MPIFVLILFILLLLLFLLTMIWPPDSPWSPWWRTNKKTAQIMCKLAKIKKGDIVYDLGSGDGQALLRAGKLGSSGVGIEIDPTRALYSRILMKLNNLNLKIKIKRANFFDVDLSPATVVIAYLVPKTLSKLKPKLLKELRPGTKIVTFVYKIDLPMIAEDKKNEIYVYKIPKLK